MMCISRAINVGISRRCINHSLCNDGASWFTVVIIIDAVGVRCTYLCSESNISFTLVNQSVAIIVNTVSRYFTEKHIFGNRRATRLAIAVIVDSIDRVAGGLQKT